MISEVIYISKPPSYSASGGGSGTFSWNFHNYCQRFGIRTTRNILLATRAIIIAQHGFYPLIWAAKKNGCKIIHRLDECYEPMEMWFQFDKHRKIYALNKLADFTVFQSEFNRSSLIDVLQPKSEVAVIMNGGDINKFSPNLERKIAIGHISNSIGFKKRFDLLENFILQNETRLFHLIGNYPIPLHENNHYLPNMPNVEYRGVLRKCDLPAAYNQMKMLYFPSQDDSCPNSVIEAILCGVPVCYNNSGGTPEIVQDCGLPLERASELLDNLEVYSVNCLKRRLELDFDKVAMRYLSL